VINRALNLPPHFWPALPDPASENASEASVALYAELEKATAA
jgi:hypothetical protein